MKLLMAMPHTIEYYKQIDNSDENGVVTAESYADAVLLQAMVQPTDPNATFTATGVLLHKPHNVFVPLADADGWKLGDKITFAGDDYYISAPVKRWRGVGIDYAVVTIADKDGDE